MKINRIKKLKGMTLMEVIIGMFIFVVIMLAVTMIFTSSFGGYRKSEKMAKNIEDAQYTMNLMAKSLRTSKIISMTPSNASATTILAYDYSKSGGTCEEFSFATAGQVTLKSAADTVTCAGAFASATANPIANQYISGSFSGTPSVATVPGTPGTMGKVTIKMKVCSDPNCATGGSNDQAFLQTTVSLRDYSTVGL